jgi:hypothetical protein
VPKVSRRKYEVYCLHLRDRNKGSDKKSRISRAIVVVAIIFVNFWGFLCGHVMWFNPRREDMWYSGSSRDFGTRGCCDVRMITSIYFVLKLYPTSVRNHVIYGVAYVGISLWRDELPHSLTISWLLEKKSREIWSLEVHRTRITKFAWLEGFKFRKFVYENFRKSYWVCIQNVKYFHSRNHLPFFLGDNTLFLKTVAYGSS